MVIVTRLLIIAGVILAIGAIDNLYITSAGVALIAAGVYLLHGED